jgi:hypothetical protein
MRNDYEQNCSETHFMSGEGDVVIGETDFLDSVCHNFSYSIR